VVLVIIDIKLDSLVMLFQLSNYYFVFKNLSQTGIYPVFQSWDSLSFQVYFTLTASNVAFVYWSHDIGGHILPSPPELYTRCGHIIQSVESIFMHTDGYNGEYTHHCSGHTVQRTILMIGAFGSTPM